MNYPFGYRKLPPVGGSVYVDLSPVPKLKAAVIEALETIQAPFHATLMTALAAASAGVKSVYDVETHYGSRIPTGLAICVIADSGERKDPLVKFFFRGMSRLERDLDEQLQDEMKQYRANKVLWDVRHKYILNAMSRGLRRGVSIESEEKQLITLFDEEPVKPEAHVLMVEDITSPSFTQQLKRSGASLSVVSPEGGNFLKNLRRDADGILNAAITGSTLSVGRVSTGLFQIHDPRISLFFAVQPLVIHEFRERRGEQVRGSGFFARVLFSSPQSTQGYRPSTEGSPVMPARQDFSDRLYELAEAGVRISKKIGGNRGLLQLLPEAKSLACEVGEAIEIEIRDGGRFEFARDHASKLLEMILRTAACLHVVEGFNDGISAQTLRVAINICLYCSDEFLRIFTGPPQEVQDMQVLMEWIRVKANPQERFITVARLQAFGPWDLRKRKVVKKAIEGLIAYGAITEFLIYGKRATRALDLMPSLGAFDEQEAIRQLNLPRVVEYSI